MVQYENSLIYKICCKDPTITDNYIGSTCAFRKRKINHKSNCTDQDATFYNQYVSGQYESASHVFGIGVNYDAMVARQSVNFKSASYNYSIQSELNANPQSIFIYCNAGTALEKAASNQVVFNI
jgi:hypothetical protein